MWTWWRMMNWILISSKDGDRNLKMLNSFWKMEDTYGSEIEKMSKRWHNVVNPDDMVNRYGADCLRLYEMFLGPSNFQNRGIPMESVGLPISFCKLWKLYHRQDSNSRDLVWDVSDAEPTKAELKALHKTIKKIVEDIDRYSFNTSVSNFMICVNELTDLKCNKRAILEPLAIIVSPYSPHIAEELWEKLGHKESITRHLSQNSGRIHDRRRIRLSYFSEWENQIQLWILPCHFQKKKSNVKWWMPMKWRSFWPDRP